MDFDDPIDRRKWLARLVTSAKGHAQKAGRPFELRSSLLRPCTQLKRGAATLPGTSSTIFDFLMPSLSTLSRRA
jgi:hypothetical protein